MAMTTPRRAQSLLTAAGLALLAVLVAVLALQHADRQRLADVQAGDGPALTTARRSAAVLFSYDAGRLDADLAAALPLTTGSYTGTYRDAVQRVVGPAAKADGSVVTATVRQSGATAATTSGRLVALVLLDRTTQRPGAQPATDSTQLRMTLVHAGGRWLVSGVETL